MKLITRIVCGLAASACLLMAQGDPPGRVARLSYMYRSVSFLPAGVGDWVPADFNRPLTTGDHVFADMSATAELQIGSAALRLNSVTSIEFLNLDDSNVQLRMTEGGLNIRLRYLGDQDSFEVDTPNLALSLLRTGEYKIEVKPDSSVTIVTVRGGEAEVTGSDQAFAVHAGQQVRVTGIDEPRYESGDVPPRNEWDTWCAQRDQRDDQSPSARYVSRELVGYQDLDQYGSWRTTSAYGAVWVPKDTPGGWAPYHNGHWLWVDPWGWTWVDDSPWGFAPFHYGRWAYVDGYWGWVPGPVAERPVYAPALVAWVGGGAIAGGVAWFPLGPKEVFVPTYHTSPVYLNRVNVTNTVIVNNINITNVNVTNVKYVNREAPGAVMAVQQTAFASARPVQSAAIAVRPEALRSATVVATAAVSPTRASVTRAAAPGAKVAQPPAALQASSVVAKRTPPPPPVPFSQKQQALAANAGRPLDVNQVQQLRQKQPPPAPLVKQVQARAPAAAPIARPAPGARPEASPAPSQDQNPSLDQKQALRRNQLRRAAAPTPAAPAAPAATTGTSAGASSPSRSAAEGSRARRAAGTGAPGAGGPTGTPAGTSSPSRAATAKTAAPVPAPRAEPPRPAPQAEERKQAPQAAPAVGRPRPLPKKDDKGDKDKKKDKKDRKDDKN